MTFATDSESTDPQGTLAEERHLQQLQRMAMLGTLAAGLGHDLRNLVMPVLLRLDVMSASQSLPEDARADLAGIRRSIAHLQRLAGGLKLLSSDPFDQRDETQITRLHEWWRELHPIVTDALPPYAVVDATFPASLPAASVPPGVLAQVVINLVMNARRAMEGTPVPRIELRVREERDQLCLTVSDNGKGMDSETRRRCFEPYFSTRPREYATGLGLSTGRALMSRYGGDLMLSSATNGVGAAFAIHLPIHRPHAREGSRGVQSVRLLVSDPRHRALIRRIVTQHGMHEAVSTGDDLIDAFICDAGSLPLVLAHRQERSEEARCRVIVLGRAPNEALHLANVVWTDTTNLSQLGELLREVSPS